MISTRIGFEVFSFPVTLTMLVFTYRYVEILAVPTTSLINNEHLSTSEPVFLGEKSLNTTRALEKNLKVKATVKFIDPSAQLFGEDSAL